VFLALSDQKFLIQTYGNTPDYTVREISGLNPGGPEDSQKN